MDHSIVFLTYPIKVVTVVKISTTKNLHLLIVYLNMLYCVATISYVSTYEISYFNLLLNQPNKQTLH